MQPTQLPRPPGPPKEGPSWARWLAGGLGGLVKPSAPSPRSSTLFHGVGGMGTTTVDKGPSASGVRAAPGPLLSLDLGKRKTPFWGTEVTKYAPSYVVK